VLISRFTLLILTCSFTASLAQNTDEPPKSFFEAGKRYYKEQKLDSAVVMLTKARDLAVEGSLDEADACSILGEVYKYELYDFDRAETNYERALLIRQNLDPNGAKPLSRLYYSLAATNRSQHDYETSISWATKAIRAGVELKDNVFLERAYSIVGNIYRDVHQFDSAVVYYQKGADVNRELNKGKDNVTLAGLYGGWGEINYRQNDLDEASKKLGYAVSIYKKSKNVDNAIYFHTVRLLGEVETKRNKFESAKLFLKMADDIRKERSLERGGPVSSLFKNYGDYALATGDKKQAIDFYQKALQATTNEQLSADRNPTEIAQVQFKEFAYDALLAKAALVNDEQALDCYSAAERLMAWSRNELDTEHAKWNYIDANYRLYENIFDVLTRMKDNDESVPFHYMELSKSKSLADALQEVELKKALGRNDTLFTKLRGLRQEALSIQHQIDEKNEATTRDQLIASNQEISKIETAISEKYPSYLATRYEGQSVPLASVKEKIKKLDAVFVEYFWGYEHIYALVITGDSTEFYQLGRSSDVGEKVSQYLEMFVRKGNHYSPEAVSEFSRLSNALYLSLLDPLGDRLPGRKRLIVVPDGPLMQVPFETLVTQPGNSYNSLQYILNDHVVSYVFSASHLLAGRQKPVNSPSMLAFGFTGGAAASPAEATRRLERSPDASMTEIAGSETELIALNNKFPKGIFLYGDGVTEKNFKDKAADYDLLHLAVHGSGDTGEDYSATLYFRDQQGPEDGRLYWYELYNMNLHASLAVLSSCESGIGKTYRGEGMLSMANAFTFAGCDNVVMGLWKVDDQVSVKLMDTFYSELLDGMAIDEALAIAKRTYLASADQVSANPKLWGSLVAYGEAPILRADEIPTWWVVVALTVLAAAITLLVIKTRKK
jgi:CHAT domain-containing protein